MNDMSPVIVPAVIPTSAEQVRETCRLLSFSAEYHLDIVDGRFVPAVSWPVQPIGTPAEVRMYTDRFTLEVDLMVVDPVPMAQAWEAAGADMIVFHVETITVNQLATFVQQSKVSIGVSLHGETSLTALEPYLEYADYVQLMGIETIGAQGLPFTESVLDAISWVRTNYPTHMISVDGSMNAATIPRVRAAGAQRIICGSAIIGQPNPAAAYRALVHLVDGAR